MSDNKINVICEYEISVDGSDGSYSIIYSLTHKQYSGASTNYIINSRVCKQHATDYEMHYMCGGIYINKIMLYKIYDGSDEMHMDASIRVEIELLESALNIIKNKYNTHQADVAMMNAAYKEALSLKALLERELDIHIIKYKLCYINIKNINS